MKVLSWRRKQDMVELFRISKGREFQMIGATEKLQDPKQTRNPHAIAINNRAMRNQLQ